MTSERLERGKAYRGESALKVRWYRWNGEKRAPQKGEYYLSGAVITAYKALGDLSYAYHIAIEVPAPSDCPVCKGTGKIRA